jgi:hypothetical protein
MKNAEANLGWHQDGFDITYEPSPYTKETNELNPSKVRPYMQLSFSYEFRSAYDEVICAYTLPYTYTHLRGHLKQLKLL